MATRYDPAQLMTTSPAERARVTSMLIVIGIIVLITAISAFVAGRLQAKGAHLKHDLMSTSVQDGDPAQNNPEERERLRIMKQLNDQLLLGVITGGIITISILIVSMLIVNMGEAQRHYALERVEQAMPLPQLMVPAARAPASLATATYGGDMYQAVDAAASTGRSAPPAQRRRINRNMGGAGAPAKASSVRAANARVAPPPPAVPPPPPVPLTGAELAEHISNDDFSDKKMPQGTAFDASIRGVGNMNDRPGGERDQFIASEAAKLVSTFHSMNRDKQADREALRAQLGDVDDLDMDKAMQLTRQRYGIQSNANLERKRNAVFSGGMFGRVTGDGDDASPTRLY